MLTLRQLSHLESSGLCGWKPGRSVTLLPPLHSCHCHRGRGCSSSPGLRCNSYTIQVLNSGGFGIFTRLCNHHHSQISKHFITPKRSPMVLNCNHSPFLLPIPGSQYFFLFLNILYKWDHEIRGFLYLASFT